MSELPRNLHLRLALQKNLQTKLAEQPILHQPIHIYTTWHFHQEADAAVATEGAELHEDAAAVIEADVEDREVGARE